VAQGSEPFDESGVFSRLMREARPVWNGLQSRSRHALILARELRSQGFVVFAPVTRRTATYGETVVAVDAAVFPDLVFVFGTGQQISALAAANPRVRQVVELRAQDGRIELSVSRARRLLGLPVELPETHDDTTPSSGFLMGPA
jgi:hypothetical protein